VKQDYVTDVPYTGEFFEHLSPAWMGYVAAINGYSAPALDGKFTWCELGCGKGVTSLLLAGMYPQGEFHACDFNEEHIAYAERLRSASDVGNAHFYAKTFAQMLDFDLPQFDFITLHGVYGWVPDPARAEIREFLRRKLKPGGLAMVSYNAMPGWAHLQPLRHIMRTYADTLSAGNSLDKAKAAYGFTEFLSKNGAAFFSTLPAAAAHVKEMAAQDIRYVVHEYITPYGDSFYFSEIEPVMRSLGLAYAGNMRPTDNYVDTMAPRQFRSLLESTTSRTVLETWRDFIVNSRFRMDLYAAQPARGRTGNATLDRFNGMLFGLTALPERLPFKSTDGDLRFNLENQSVAVGKVHECLAKGPASAEAIHAALGCSAQEAATFIQHLVVIRHVAPCPPVPARSGWMPLNSALVEAGINEQAPQILLVCPLTGSVIYNDAVQAASIEAAALSPDADAAARAVLARFRISGHPLIRQAAAGVKRPATDEELGAYVRGTWTALHDTNDANARMLRLFGVLA